MIDKLLVFSNEIQRMAKNVGVDGKMGGQAEVSGIGGRWKEITADVVMTNGSACIYQQIFTQHRTQWRVI